MKNAKQNIENGRPIIAQSAPTFKSLGEKLRELETAMLGGGDYTPEITAVSVSAVKQVLSTCIDPQRKTATMREKVSDSGCNPAMLDLRRGVYADLETLESTRHNASKATETRYNDNGDLVTEIVDSNAETAFNALIQKALSDGIDLVQEGICAILEQAQTHADGIGWLERPYTVRRLSKRVYIQSADSRQYREVETTPIQEVYRAIRKAIENSRAMQTDPRNGYTYIEDIGGTDGLETAYIRLDKYADLGGYNCNGNYTADTESAESYHSILAKLNLTERQATIIKLRMRGYGQKSIGTYLGIPHQNVLRTMKQVQKKCETIGFTPEMWAEMTKGE